MYSLRTFCLFLICTFFTTSLFAQGALWAKGIPIVDLTNTAGFISQGNDVVQDAAGNIYSTGVFYGTQQFGNDELTSDGFVGFTSHDGFIAKYNSQGDFQEVHQFKCPEIGGLSHLEIDAQGNLYFAGLFRGPVTIADQTAGLSNQYAVIVGKLNPSGEVLWINAVPSVQSVMNLKFGAGGSLFIAGNFTGTADFGSASASAADGDFYLASLNSMNGEAAYVTAFGKLTLNANLGLALDAGGNAYCASNSTGGATFGAFALPGDDYTSPPFLIKVNPQGAIQWLQSGTAANSGTLSPRALAINQATGDIFLGGAFNADSYTLGTITFEQNPYTGTHSVLAKYNAAGEAQWVRTSKQDANASAVGILDLQVADNGDCFAIGTFKNGTNAYLNTSNGPFNLSAPNGLSDSFLIRYSDDGEFDWGHILWADGELISTPGIAIAGPNQVAVTGRYFDSLELGNLSLPAVYPGSVSKENIFTAVIDGDLMVNTTSPIATPSIWNLYPNPATEYLVIEQKFPDQIDAMQIVNTQGRVVNIQTGIGDKELVNIADLPAGLYSVQLISDHQIYSQNFIKL